MQFQISKDTVTVSSPPNYYFRNVLDFASELDTIPISDNYVFDFTAFSISGHAPPFGLLFASRAIRQFRNKRKLEQPNANFRVMGHSHQYASHMGFWKCLGVNGHVNKPQAAGSHSYRPISSTKITDLQAIRQNKAVKMSALLDSMAMEQASILTQNSKCPIQNTLHYSLRELFRNISEHSESPEIWHCMQYWPTKDKVELAVLDEGRGIQSSLSENPKYDLQGEKQAIVKATQRGVSRVNPANMQHPAMWDGYGAAENENAGYGLFVLKQLAAQAGELAIVSNDSCVRFIANQTIYFSQKLNFQGTAIRLLLRPNQLDNVLNAILQQFTDGKSPSKLSPSLLAKLPD